LGVIRDLKLNFKAYIQLLKGKVVTAVGILNKLKFNFPKFARLF